MQRKSVAPFSPRLRTEPSGTDAAAYARSEVSDELLMVRYQRGDRAAFASLVKRHQRGVYNFFLRRARDAARADALAQEVFLRLVQRSGEFKNEARFRTWLYSIVRSLRVEVREASPPSSRPRETASETPSIGQSVTQAVEGMPSDLQEVYLLREAGNLSFKEIAELLGCPESVVLQRMRQALERLQQAISGLDEFARGLK